MAKHPYITFWIGDWIRDTRRLSIGARGAWIDLLCYMSMETITGVITGDITEYARLLGENEAFVTSLLDEISQKNICDRENMPDGRIKLTCRRMVKDAVKSAKKSEAGKKGMAKRYQKKETVTNPVITDDITKQQQNSGNGIGIGYGNDDNFLQIGGVGERESFLPMKLAECVELYRSPPYDMIRATLCRNLNSLPPAELLEWLDVFVALEESGGHTEKTMEDFTRHFRNWTIQKLQQGKLTDPKTYFKNATTTNNGKAGSPAKGSGGTHATAVIDRDTNF